jgi:hypothetical protein
MIPLKLEPLLAESPNMEALQSALKFPKWKKIEWIPNDFHRKDNS